MCFELDFKTFKCYYCVVLGAASADLLRASQVSASKYAVWLQHCDTTAVWLIETTEVLLLIKI